MPPGSLVHIGERRDFTPRLTVFHYDSEQWKELNLTEAEGCFPYRDGGGVAWINVDGIHQVETIDKIGKYFNLHPLTLEDIVNTEQRPKIEEHDNYLFCVLKMLYPISRSAGGKASGTTQQSEKILIEQVSLVLGRNYVISFQESIEGDVFDSIRERIRNNHGKMRRQGADYLAYALMDAVVDSYFVILEKMGEKFEQLEVELLDDPQHVTLHKLQALKRDMIDLRKSVWPLREVIGSLLRSENELVRDATKRYLTDVYDHTIHVIDTIEAYRDLLGGMLEIYLSSVSNRLNSIMKVLTMIATIFIPLNFVVGVYGMNFEFMPELHWRYGYFGVWAVMLSAVGVMVYFFRKQRWL